MSNSALKGTLVGVRRPLVRLGRSRRASGFLLILAGGVVTASLASAVDAPTPVDINVGKSPLSVAVDSSTDLIYAANSGSFNSAPGSVSVIDGHTKLNGQANSGKVIATIGVGHNPWGIAVNSKTHRVYVSNRGSSSVTVIDGHTNKVVATVGVGQHPLGVGVAPAKDLIYVANQGTGKSAGTVSVINGHSNKVVGTINVGFSPTGVGVNTASSTVYVGNYGGAGPSTNYAGNVSVIRGENVVATVNVGGSPSGIAVDQATNAAYVAISSQDEPSTVGIINGDNKLVAQIALQNPYGNSVTVDSAIHAVFVGDMYSGSASGPVGTVSVINTKTNGEIAEASVGGNPWGIGVDTNTGRVYVANDTSPGTVGMLDFSHYPIVGGTPPRKITAPIATPTIPSTTTTTTTKAGGAPAPNTPLPQTNNKLANCDVFTKAGGPTLSIYGTLGQSAVNPSGSEGCTVSTPLQIVYFEHTAAEYTWAASRPTTPTGLGAGAQLWINGDPGNRGLYVTFRVAGGWVALTDNYYNAPATATEHTYLPAFLTVARQLYSLLGGG